MSLQKFFRQVVLISCAVLFSTSAHADWVLDGEQSHLSYGSIKQNSLGEVNHFQKLSGMVDQKGNVNIMIDLASVESWIDIRNERLREFLFKISEFPEARLSSQIDVDKLSKLNVGKRAMIEATFQLDLAGQSQSFDAELIVIRLDEKRTLVLPHELIFVDADDFELLPGLAKLQELAGLDSISSAVPVSFYLTFVDK